MSIGSRCTVVIPVFNKAPYLRECLDSVFAQTFREFDLIVVDDASTDGSLALLRTMSDPRLTILELPHNLGPAGAAQRAMDAATGEYIVRMDADDIMLPERIAEQIAFMDANKDVGASGTSVRLLHDPLVIRHASASDEEIRAGILFQIPLFQPASIYRRSVLLEHNIRLEDDWPRYGEDWLYQLRLLTVTRLANLQKPLLLYREGDQNSAHGRDRAADLRMLFKAVAMWCGLPVNEDRLRSHLHAMNVFTGPLGREDVRAMKRYLTGLADWNKETRVFSPDEFQRRSNTVWDAWAYQMPRFGWAVTLAYIANDHRRSLAKLRYQLATLLSGKVYRAR